MPERREFLNPSGYARDKDASYGDFYGGQELGDAQRRARVLKVIELIARSSEIRR
jgi:hypothetical protein